MGNPEAGREQVSEFENAMALVEERRPVAYIDSSYMTAVTPAEYVALGVQLDNGAEENSFSQWRGRLSEEQIEKFKNGSGLDIWYVAFQMAKALSKSEEDFGTVLRRASSLLKLGNILAKRTYECLMDVKEVTANLKTRQGRNECRVMCLVYALGFDPDYQKLFRNFKFANAVRQDLGIEISAKERQVAASTASMSEQEECPGICGNELLEAIKAEKRITEAHLTRVLNAFLNKISPTEQDEVVDSEIKAINILRAEVMMREWMVRELGEKYISQVVAESKRARTNEFYYLELEVPAEFQKYVEMRDRRDSGEKEEHVSLAQLKDGETEFVKDLLSRQISQSQLSEVPKTIGDLAVNVRNLKLGILGEARYQESIAGNVKVIISCVKSINSRFRKKINVEKLLEEALGASGLAVLQEELKRRAPAEEVQKSP